MIEITFTLRPIVVKGHRWSAGPTANHRMHWRQRAELTKIWRTAAWAEMRRHRIVPVERISVTLTRYSVRDVDDDNLHGGFKAIVDGIVDSGIVVDDTRTHVQRVVDLVRVKHFADERLEIRVTPADA